MTFSVLREFNRKQPIKNNAWHNPIIPGPVFRWRSIKNLQQITVFTAKNNCEQKCMFKKIGSFAIVNERSLVTRKLVFGVSIKAAYSVTMNIFRNFLFSF